MKPKFAFATTAAIIVGLFVLAFATKPGGTVRSTAVPTEQVTTTGAPVSTEPAAVALTTTQDTPAPATLTSTPPAITEPATQPTPATPAGVQQAGAFANAQPGQTIEDCQPGGCVVLMGNTDPGV